MNKTAIEIKNLSKRYRLGERLPYKTLRDALGNFMSSAIKSNKKAEEFIWALDDISLTVDKAEAVGVIGRNGAGKTTLLKILSRITRPTKGLARVSGRVRSLLEIGTGFHSELTGRENIFLNGALLGMRKSEIESKFKEIVSFSEIEKFLDTPVKHYSSGMYMRLAFAVAAHLEPEILLVDEVLAVGDASFQKKCLGKMDDVTRGGRTVLFVSHNMAAINRLCRKVIWLDEGKVKMFGPTQEVVSSYLAFGEEFEGQRRWVDEPSSPGNDNIRLRSVRLLDVNQQPVSSVDAANPFFVEIEYKILNPVSGVQVGFWLISAQGIVVFVSGDKEDVEWADKTRQPGIYKSACKIPGLLLNSGMYSLTIASDVFNNEAIFVKEGALSFQVEQTRLPAHSSTRPAGIICPFLEWHITKTE
ncbi:MAG: ABC transporter ATP-binding protein [Candidatus Omnitrophica bacterium]|nr:ABC transporter ATP-binding protein [Candidatus Omnitrophota bacterium]MBU1869746.1 ABC transporter ATP-binding protein [Candidatus Omnitrophota bacterium]